MPSKTVTLVASTAQTVVVSNGDPVLDEIADAPDRYLIPSIDILEVVNLSGSAIVYFNVGFASGFNGASAGHIPSAPTVGNGEYTLPAEPGEYVRIRAPREHNLAIVRAISSGTPQITVSVLTRGGARGELTPGGSHDYEPYTYDVTATSPDTVIAATSPFGYWKMNDASGAPQDSSGNGNHATAAHATLTYSQAALSSKVGNSIRLSASGGRIHLPSLVASTYMGDINESWAMAGLFLLETDGLPSTNGVVWLTESQANTAGLFINYLTKVGSDYTVVQYLNTGGNHSVTSPGDIVIGTPFCWAMRKEASSLKTYLNGVLVMQTFCADDNAVGVGLDIGRNFGDSFFDSPQMRVSNVVGWKAATLPTEAALLGVCESLMDATIMAGAKVYT